MPSSGPSGARALHLLCSLPLLLVQVLGLSLGGRGSWGLRFGEENRQTLHLLSAGGLRIPFPRDCGEELKNGPSTSKTTTIFLNGNRERPLDVFCDMETDGGGWLVGSIQSPVPGLSLCSTGANAREPKADIGPDLFPGVPAPHGWTDGFLERLGGVRPWFWEHLRGILAGSVPHRAGEPGKGRQSSEPQYPDEACSTPGNEALHSLTQAGDYSMRVDLRAGKEAVFAQYDFFRVDSAKENYRLHLEGYHGTAGKCGRGWGRRGRARGRVILTMPSHALPGDSMSYHSGSVFSARDRDPNNLLISCAVSYRGAWWYRNCHYANLNGLYGSTVDHQVGTVGGHRAPHWDLGDPG